ncbi:NACHT domain-containing protein [Streptomyces sp. NA04227]|nr:NACHT domain-containing protein [Streptomyces sp. NA04227]
MLNEAAGLLVRSLRTQWAEEEGRRKVHDPFPLPVRWREAHTEVADHEPNVGRARAQAAPPPSALSGELADIAAVYQGVRSQRMVVLGRAGTGKTVLAVRLLLDLLGPPGHLPSRVPVFFSISSWNPTTTPLRRWMTQQLERDHPGLAEPLANAPSLAAALVDNELILPVLDGFDEIADGLHRPALRALNTETRMPLFLTSRTDEYAAAVRGTAVLSAAAVVELAGLELSDTADYLRRSSRRARDGTTAWDPVLERLREDPRHPASSHLSTVLRTPLMVALARDVYSNARDRTPADLLDVDRFGSPEALEDHLLDMFVPARYADEPAHRRELVPQWLGFLAGHLRRSRTTDLAWWRMGTDVNRRTRTWLVGLLGGLGFGLVDALIALPVNWLIYGYALPEAIGLSFLEALSFGAACGSGVALAHLFWGADAAAMPTRVRVRVPVSFSGGGWSRHRAATGVRGRFRQSVSRLGAGVLYGYVFSCLGFAVYIVLSTLALGAFDMGDWAETMRFHFSTSAVYLGLACGLTLALVAALEVPIDIDSAVSPSALLRTNRESVLARTLVFVLVLAVLGAVFFAVSIDVSALGLLVFVVIGGAGGGLLLIVGMTAWGQWICVVRVWLPLTGRLPWNVNAFLEDAQRRGVLRQSGAVYQFRHARLQDRLAEGYRPHR